jgi:deoxyinosine 3'endonuclease (endonuclease V)
VSVGYAITLDEALKIVRATLRDHKLPEPVHLADAYSKELKRALKGGDG